MKKKDPYRENLANMMCLDIYLSALSPEEYKKAKRKIEAKKNRVYSLVAWDVMNIHPPVKKKK